jgi:hypothetical protein
MSNSNLANSVKAQTRLELIKSGFGAFVTGIRLSLSNDTKWTLEVVCLNNKPPETAVFKDAEISKQAVNYLQNYLWDMQEKININKQKWLASMKNS